MKKLGAFLLSLFVMMSVISTASAAEKPVSVWMDGTEFKFNNWEPVTDKGTTLVPMRPLLDKLKVQLNWNGKTKTVTGTKDGLSFTLTIGSNNAKLNGKTVKLAAVPRTIHNTTYVPLRFIGDAVGYQVDWNPAKHTITLQSAAKLAASKGFMWKVQNNGNTVYLLGSIHIANEKMYPLRPEIEAAFKASDYLGVEVDLTKTDTEAMQKLILEKGVYSDGTKLKDHVSAETYSKIGEILKALKASPDAFDQFKPWVVAQTIPSLQMTEGGYEAGLGIDMYFMQNAVKIKKPIIQLETAEMQLGLFDQFSASLQEKMLNEAIEAYNHPADANAGGTSVDALTDMWKQGDEDSLVALTKASASDAEYYKALVSDRNAGMTEKVEAFLNGNTKSTYFVVVGSLHMLGDDGVVTQLVKDGFTVEKQ